MKTRTCSVIEIAGLCGAGKSTVSRVLNRRGKNIRAGFSIWQNHKIDLATSFISSLPEIAGRSFETGKLEFEPARQIIRLGAMERGINRRSATEKNSRLLSAIDEGAVFLLARNLFESKNAKISLDSLEKKLLKEWSAKLAAIVWLDAPNEVLIQRIREREKKHRMKFQSDYGTNEFLDRYRAAYEKVFSEFERSSEIEICRFDTSANSPDQIADEFVGFFDLQSFSYSRKFRHETSRTDSEKFFCEY